MAKTAHTAVSFGTPNYTESVNGKAQHTHIPRPYNGADTTYNNTMIQGGGTQECGICGQILYDNQS
jgi:hypothetical protein